MTIETPKKLPETTSSGVNKSTNTSEKVGNVLNLMDSEAEKIHALREFIISRLVGQNFLQNESKVRIPLTKKESELLIELIGGFSKKTEVYFPDYMSGGIVISIESDNRIGGHTLRVDLGEFEPIFYFNEKEGVGFNNGLETLVYGISLSKKGGKDTKNHIQSIKNFKVPIQINAGDSFDIATKNPRNFSPEGWALYQTNKPEYRIGISGRDFYVTGVRIQNGSKKAIGYTLFNGQYHPRLFYYSNSGGNWHCAPGIEDYESRISKGEFYGMSYEKGTIVVPELQNQLSKLSSMDTIIEDNSDSISKTWKGTSTPLAGYKEKNVININVEMDLLLDGVSVEKFIENTSVFGRRFASRDNGGLEEVTTEAELLNKMMWTGIPIEVTDAMSFTGKTTKSYHDLLESDVVSYYFLSIWNGKLIQITISSCSRSKPNLLWIEDIVFDIPENMSSWGFLRKQINCGIITTKPIEYTHQCPNFMNGERVIGGSYYDIRKYIQFLGPIRRAKKLLGFSGD